MNEFNVSKEEWLALLNVVDGLNRVVEDNNRELGEARAKINNLEALVEDLDRRLRHSGH